MNTNPGRSRRRAPPAIEASPTKSKSTKSLTASSSLSPCEESQIGARDRRCRPQLRPPRPRLVEQAREQLSPPFFSIIASMCSSRHALSHGPHLFFLGRRSRRRHHRRAPAVLRSSLLVSRKTKQAVPLRSLAWAASWATPCTARPRSSPDPADPAR